MFFWFVAQTGVVSHTEPTAPSNFYTYKLPRSKLARVETEVGRATVGPSGLEYRPDFLTWLDSVEVRQD